MVLFNNEIVAYKLYNHQQTPLVIDTLKAALCTRNYPEGIISSYTRIKEVFTRRMRIRAWLRRMISLAACPDVKTVWITR